MKAIIPNFSLNSNIPLYLQLYNYIKQSILSKEIVPGEKLPSLRNLSQSLKVSVTTVEQAYNQLSVEGYIFSKPQSGYFISSMSYPTPRGKDSSATAPTAIPEPPASMEYDIQSFDFVKWKKCFNQVLTQYSHLLLFESNPQGERALRSEIVKYLYQSRGVRCTEDQIVIGAGVQQITSHISTILKKIGITNVSVETPGYKPVTNIFRDRSLSINPIPVHKDGIDLSLLPVNIPSAVYVNPANQFPTGAVMPIGNRYKLLTWAKENSSYIIEDDYDSELRYFGRPIPALQGLDTHNRVVYLGSFSSTLYPSIKISYMVLPTEMQKIFSQIKHEYSQTCSKAEQLTLSLFMKEGYYQMGIKKLRRLYSQKLQIILQTLSHWEKVTPSETWSGINMILNVETDKPLMQLSAIAKDLGLLVIPTKSYTLGDASPTLLFYYSHIPKEKLEEKIHQLLTRWFS